MSLTDPATGRPLQPSDTSFQRILFEANNVHVYGIPPLTSSKGFSASSWTAPPKPTAQHIFTSRLRIIETAHASTIKIDIVLEDGNTGDLFAAARYTSEAVVQQAQDSSRFFAVRVQGEGGMKATLGIGFEDRSPAFDFSVALGAARKSLGFDGATATSSSAQKKASSQEDIKQDWSLKEGQQIHIQVGQKGSRTAAPVHATAASDDGAALFSIAPPPPPTANSHVDPPGSSSSAARDLGFDDGEFGEFQ